MKQTLTIALLLFTSSFTNGQQRERVPVSEIKEIIGLAIDLPELQQYYHTASDSSRIPLKILEFGDVNAKNLVGLMKFGRPILVLSESEIKKQKLKAYLHIGDWTYGGDNLRLQMSYPIEGILINMMLKRTDGHWAIVTSMIMEE